MTDGYEGDESRQHENNIHERIRRTIDRHLEERSLSSDDTVFLDLPLPPIPDRAVEVHNVVVHPEAVVEIMYSRMDDFDVAPIQSGDNDTLSSHSSDRNSPNDYTEHNDGEARCSYTTKRSVQLNDEDGNWSTSDEESSFYRERLSMFRSESVTPHMFGSPQHHRSGECLTSAAHHGNQ